MSALIYKGDIRRFHCARQSRLRPQHGPGYTVDRFCRWRHALHIERYRPRIPVPNFECAWGGAGLPSCICRRVFSLWRLGQAEHSTPITIVAATLLTQTYDVVSPAAALRKSGFRLARPTFSAIFRRDDAGVQPCGPMATSTRRVPTWTIGRLALHQNIEAADSTLYLVYQHTDGIVLRLETPADRY